MKRNSPSPSAASSTTLAPMEESHVEELNSNNSNNVPEMNEISTTTLGSEHQHDPPSAFRITRAQQHDRDATSLQAQEWFVSQEGIDREVITADITLYLGNDALVRPGSYKNPQTGQVVAGYYVTSHQNLTPAMIHDLKEDSKRWQDEKQGTFKERTSPDDVNGLPSQIPEEDVIRMVLERGQVA